MTTRRHEQPESTVLAPANVVRNTALVDSTSVRVRSGVIETVLTPSQETSDSTDNFDLSPDNILSEQSSDLTGDELQPDDLVERERNEQLQMITTLMSEYPLEESQKSKLGQVFELAEIETLKELVELFETHGRTPDKLAFIVKGLVYYFITRNGNDHKPVTLTTAICAIDVKLTGQSVVILPRDQAQKVSDRIGKGNSKK
jgi:hypothetical protein